MVCSEQCDFLNYYFYFVNKKKKVWKLSQWKLESLEVPLLAAPSNGEESVLHTCPKHPATF